MARFMRKPTADSGDWHEMRDPNGKLCARIDPKRLVLEIKRSDRNIVAVFDLREYLAVLREIE